MNLAKSYETEVAAKSHPSLSALREWIASHPNTAEYVLHTLLDSGVLKVGERGVITGSAKARSATNPTQWGETWPARDDLIGCLNSETYTGLGAVRKALGSGQWATWHALKALIRQGVVREEKGKYALVEAAKESAPKADPELTNRVRAALQSLAPDIHHAVTADKLAAAAKIDRADLADPLAVLEYDGSAVRLIEERGDSERILFHAAGPAALEVE